MPIGCAVRTTSVPAGNVADSFLYCPFSFTTVPCDRTLLLATLSTAKVSTSAVGGQEPADLLDERLGHLDAALEGGVAVRLGQDRQPVAEADVVLADAWLVGESAPGPVGTLAGDVAVVVGAELVLVIHRLGDG